MCKQSMAFLFLILCTPFAYAHQAGQMPSLDNHALIGYALDGFGIYSMYGENGRELTNTTWTNVMAESAASSGMASRSRCTTMC